MTLVPSGGTEEFAHPSVSSHSNNAKVNREWLFVGVVVIVRSIAAKRFTETGLQSIVADFDQFGIGSPVLAFVVVLCVCPLPLDANLVAPDAGAVHSGAQHLFYSAFDLHANLNRACVADYGGRRHAHAETPA